jgi:hypothetical protein
VPLWDRERPHRGPEGQKLARLRRGLPVFVWGLDALTGWISRGSICGEAMLSCGGILTEHPDGCHALSLNERATIIFVAVT